MKVNDATDYIIKKVLASNSSLSHLKLQKLLYYCKAWYLAYTGQELFKENFQAWVHGPVCRDIYDRFKNHKSLYEEIDDSDTTPGFDIHGLDPNELGLIDSVLNAYAQYSGGQLESLTHTELPWINARSGYGPFDRCENLISNDDMKNFYGQKIQR